MFGWREMKGEQRRGEDKMTKLNILKISAFHKPSPLLSYPSFPNIPLRQRLEGDPENDNHKRLRKTCKQRNNYFI